MWLKYIKILSKRQLTHTQKVTRCYSHVPVMANEITQLMKPADGKVYIDMTFGGGGHSRHLLDSNKSIKVVAVDRDPVAIRKAHQLAAEIQNKSQRLNINQSVIPVHGKFSTVMREIHLNGIEYDSVDGIIFDLGASSMQFDDPARGFALSSDGPLDMRMDPTNSSDLTAEDVVNNLSVESLALILKILGEERRSIKISNAIVDGRQMLGRIRTTKELVRIVETCSRSTLDSLGRYANPSTRLFQALRIFVNNELNEINYALDKISAFLKPSNLGKSKYSRETLEEPYGVVAVLTFHSLEDKIVKRHFSGDDPNEPSFKYLSQHDRIRTNTIENLKSLERFDDYKNWRPLLKHVKKPSEDEVAANPRSRSAKLRAAVRVK